MTPEQINRVNCLYHSPIIAFLTECNFHFWKKPKTKKPQPDKNNKHVSPLSFLNFETLEWKQSDFGVQHQALLVLGACGEGQMLLCVCPGSGAAHTLGRDQLLFSLAGSSCLHLGLGGCWAGGCRGVGNVLCILCSILWWHMLPLELLVWLCKFHLLVTTPAVSSQWNVWICLRDGALCYKRNRGAG